MQKLKKLNADKFYALVEWLKEEYEEYEADEMLRKASFAEDNVLVITYENGCKDVVTFDNKNTVTHLNRKDDNWRCGQGDNKCSCESPKKCGYIEMHKLLEQWQKINNRVFKSLK